MTMRRKLPFLLVAMLAACTVGPDYRPPAAGLTPTYLNAAAIDARGADADWWRRFDDPLLATLIARAVAGNTDLAQARARIDQSRAAARAAGARLLPTVDATAVATAVSQSRETPVGRVSRALDIGRGYSEYAVGAQASWEIDLFGGLKRGREAARDDLAASEAGAEAVAVAVAAETADAYVALRGLQARLAVAQEQAENEALLTNLVRQRFEQGVAAERELNRAIGELEGVRASMAPLRAGIEAQLNRIDVLLGTQPGTNRTQLVRAVRVPVAPVPAGSAAPADLLRRRPDVIAAERRLAASTARIGVAFADYYPRLSLSGLVGVAGLGTGRLFTGGAVQASGGGLLRWRLFDFGRVDAEVAGARGRQAEALAQWRGSVLSAAEDVETALSRLGESHVRRGALEKQVAALRRARDQAKDAYAGGVLGLIEVTDANRQLLLASDQLAASRAEEARAAIAGYRALGGGWAEDDEDATATMPTDNG